MQLLETFYKRGIVVVASDEISPRDGDAEFFRAWALDPKTAAERLRSARVLLVGLEPWGSTVCQSLAAAGVGTIHVLADERRPPDVPPSCRVSIQQLTISSDFELQGVAPEFQLIIVCLRSDEIRAAMAVSRFAQVHNIPSIYGTMENFSAVAGPLVIPGQTPCWNCARLRTLANAENLEVNHALQAALLSERSKPRVSAYLSPMTGLLGNLLAFEGIKFITKFTSSTLAGHQVLHNLMSLETSRHAIVRMPWCEVCGGASSSSAPSGGPVGNLAAAKTPEELRVMLDGIVDERSGIISHLAVHAAEPDDPELPITCSAALCAYTEGHYHEKTREIGSGKAFSTVHAMIGAVGEAIERYSAGRYRKKLLHRAKRRELDSESLDPNALALYDLSQYSESTFPFCLLDPEQPIEWVEGRWLRSGSPVWLPALPVYFNFHVPKKESFCQVSSNGLAAGPDITDAGWRAAFELIERDTFMLAWLSRQPGRRIAFDRSVEPEVQELIRQIERFGARVECCVLDVGTQIPVVVCIAWGDSVSWPGATVSIAAERSLHQAARKALLEQGHVGPYIRRVAKQSSTQFPASPADVRSLLDHALYYVDTKRATELTFLGAAGEIPYSSIVHQSVLTREECLDRLDGAGIRLAIADVTSPDLLATPFRVARAIGEYIQQIDFGYHVRRLGNPRLKRLLQGREANPAPHPIA